MQDQKQTMQFLSLVNPFGSLQSVSMGLCGTDQWNHLHFQQEAEMYRRDFIRALNYEHTYGGSKTGDWGWKAEQEFFNNIDDFYYQTPPYTAGASIYWLDWLSLFLWIIISISFLRTATKNDSAAV
jgi:ABC-2 type transport system permease protein